jgi:hypothetical protein
MEQFREIWSEVLSLEAEEIADDANFFECKILVWTTNNQNLQFLTVGGDSVSLEPDVSEIWQTWSTRSVLTASIQVKGLQMIGKAASLKFNLDLDTLYARMFLEINNTYLIKAINFNYWPSWLTLT